MEPVAPAPARHQAAGEFVDDDDLAVLDHVVDVEPEDGVRAQRLFDVVLDVRVFHVVEVAAVQPVGEELLGRLHPAFRQRDGLVFLIDDVIASQLERVAILGLRVALGLGARLQPGNDAIDFVVEVGRRLGGPEMMSGVRASSMRMLSTSSTIAKWCPRWTYCDSSNFMLSRR